MKNFCKKLIILLFFFISFLEAKDIKIGMSADFSGSISYLGNNMKTGILTYFNTYNKTSKHKFKLITYDDKYNPILASQNVRTLIDEENVIAFLGNVGTPTANVVIPILSEKKIVLLGAYSGGNILRQKELNKYVFNYRASYAQEAFSIITNLLKLGLKPNQIALFTQNDTYGDSGYTGALKAFKVYGHDKIANIIHGRYTRGTLNIEIALSKMLDTEEDIKAVVMVGVDKPTIKFIKYAKEDFPWVKFFSLSPINSKDVATQIGVYSKDMYTTQVVPLLSSKIEIVQEYKKNLKEQFPNIDANIISFEGYIVAKLFVEVIKDLDLEKIDSQQVFEQLTKMKNIDIGLGFVSFFDSFAHQYSSKLWLSTVKDGKIVEVKWKEIFK